MKEKGTFSILAICLGSVGAHRFYIRQPTLAIVYLLFCWTFIPLLIGIIEGIVWLFKTPEQFAAMVAKIEAENEARRAAKVAAAAAKRQKIVDQYGEQWADLILNKKISQGMPLNAVIAAWGKPGKVKEEVGKNGTKHKLYYQPYTNSQKKTSYRMEVRIEDGVVEGWKEL